MENLQQFLCFSFFTAKRNSVNHTEANYIHASGGGGDGLLKSKPSIRTGQEGDLSDFDRWMAVGARWADGRISEITDFEGFTPINICQVCRESSENEKISSEQNLFDLWQQWGCSHPEEIGQTGSRRYIPMFKIQGNQLQILYLYEFSSDFTLCKDSPSH